MSNPTRPFSADEVKFRVGNKNEKGASCLVYIDMRQASARLQELDPNHRTWREGEPIITDTGQTDRNGSPIIHVAQYVGIEVNGATRVDVGEESDVLVPKGGLSKLFKSAMSDGVKRCAVQFGIGAELYDGPFLWLDKSKLTQYGISDAGTAELRRKWAAYVASIGGESERVEARKAADAKLQGSASRKVQTLTKVEKEKLGEIAQYHNVTSIEGKTAMRDALLAGKSFEEIDALAAMVAQNGVDGLKNLLGAKQV